MIKLINKKHSLFSRAVKRIVKKIRQSSGVPVAYPYDGFSIDLPSYHLLPEHQKEHPKYDRFLPHLVKFVNDADTVVDVGANVGDTLAGMIEKNPSASFICIEPDDCFYRHLEANVKKIKKTIPGLNVRAFKALVGKNISNVSLVGEGGTKRAVLNEVGGVKSLPLDEIIKDDAGVRIRLLKSDVDGFDFDVIDSSMSVVEKHKSIVFFECQFDFEYQKEGYVRTLRSMEEVGYCDWTVFDNFGEVVVRTGSVDVVLQLMNYVWKQNTGKTTRTINYYDILAVQGVDSELIDRVLAEYDEIY